MRLVVSNAGVHPALSFVAEAASRHPDIDLTYFTSGSLAADSHFWKILARSGLASTRVGRTLERRRLPRSLSKRDVELLSAAGELHYLLMRRLSAERARDVLERRAAHFDASVARRLSGRGPGVVLAQSSSAYQTMTSARKNGLVTVLNAPIAHSSLSNRLLDEEAQLEPAWAGTLPRRDQVDSAARPAPVEIELADHVFCAGQFIRRSYESAGYPAARIHTIPLGVDTRVFKPRVRSPDGVFRVIFAGQLTQRKGLSYLIEAFRELRGPARKELVLVGSPVGNVLSLLPRHRDIRFVSSLPRPELARLYADSDVFVLPSIVEGFAQTPLEAMACGLPVIVSENMDVTQVIADWQDGVVVPIRNSARIHAALERLAGDPALRQQMGARAVAKASRYTWGRFAERYVDELIEVSR